METGTPKALRLRVEYTGTDGAALTIDAPPPFLVDHETLALESGKSADLVVSFQPAWPGKVVSKLKLRVADTEIVVPLSADVASRILSVTGTDGKTKKVAVFVTPPAAETDSRAELSAVGVPPVPRNWSGVPAIDTLTIDRVSGGTAEISWRAPGPPAIHSRLKYRIDVRVLEFDDTGAMHVVWVPVKTVDFAQKADRVQARINEIPRGIGVSLRVISLTPKGFESIASGTVQFFTPPKPVIFTVQRVLLAFFGFVAVVAYWLRRRMTMPLRRE